MGAAAAGAATTAADADAASSALTDAATAAATADATTATAAAAAADAPTGAGAAAARAEATAAFAAPGGHAATRVPAPQDPASASGRRVASSGASGRATLRTTASAVRETRALAPAPITVGLCNRGCL